MMNCHTIRRGEFGDGTVVTVVGCITLVTCKKTRSVLSIQNLDMHVKFEIKSSNQSERLFSTPTYRVRSRELTLAGKNGSEVSNQRKKGLNSVMVSAIDVHY
jgi:hypothetical protein